ncbi:hypothetical protein GCM10009851_13640 [Herbiconiux moechotypicola]|uniref:Uncharacterized protein n=1 Tax=Herbiconiux moechotypicola TaxID=637393 RepID=A0ABN3DFX7_9MICO
MTEPRPATGQARPGNDHARGRRNAAPDLFDRAERALVGSYWYFSRRNWRGEAKKPDLGGITIEVDRKTPDPAKPFLVRYSATHTERHARIDRAMLAVETVRAEQIEVENERYYRANPLARPGLAQALAAALQRSTATES